jgi:hypothetical protein
MLRWPIHDLPIFLRYAIMVLLKEGFYRNHLINETPPTNSTNRRLHGFLQTEPKQYCPDIDIQLAESSDDDTIRDTVAALRSAGQTSIVHPPCPDAGQARQELVSKRHRSHGESAA